MADVPRASIDWQIADALDAIATVLGRFEDPIMVPLLLAHATAACIRWARDQETPEDWIALGGVAGFLQSFDAHVTQAIGSAESQELEAVLRHMAAAGSPIN